MIRPSPIFLIISLLSALVLFATLPSGFAKDLKVAAKQNAEQKQQLELLNSTLERYRSTVAVESKLKQEVSNILDQTTTSEGKIWLSQGKMKIQFDKPERIDVVFDGQWLWQAQKTPEEFGGQWQVLKMKTNDLKKSNAAVALLFGKGVVQLKFNLVEVKIADKDEISYFLKPKDLKNSSLKKILVAIDTQTKRVLKIKLEDQAETVTKLSFSDTVFGAEINKDMFKYKVPKGAEVSTL